MSSTALDAMREVTTSEVLVVGAGVAGLSVALGLGPRKVTVVTRGRLGLGGSSPMAQGGIAAAVGADDSPSRHAADTLAVAGGLADPDVVRLLTSEAPRAIARLEELGARFDRQADSGYELSREAAHGRARVLHAGGDATGAELMRALVKAVAGAAEIQVFEQSDALELLVDQGRVVGVIVGHCNGRIALHLARAVVLASGGLGRLFSHTTNAAESTGSGLAMAARAGAQLADLEFVQFHPTALAVGADPMPLLTEALRGAGAELVDGRGRSFMRSVHPAGDLAPRDVVARAIWRRRRAGDEVFLDGRQAVGDAFPTRFPTVYRLCREHGLDPRSQPIPVAPAAHYHMGGVWVDMEGRSSLPGLWACGEVACTGAHGANRLASNSLLEALVFGARVKDDLQAELGKTLPAKVMLVSAGRGAGNVPGAAKRATASAAAAIDRIRRTMWNRVGLVRDEEGLRQALERLETLARRHDSMDCEVRNQLVLARLLATAARCRRESRGSHYRQDYPQASTSWQKHLVVTLQPSTSLLPEVEVRSTQAFGSDEVSRLAAQGAR
ncbi:MAG: L-aspartate oxidase [Thermoanaerobaculia bacterium]